MDGEGEGHDSAFLSNFSLLLCPSLSTNDREDGKKEASSGRPKFSHRLSKSLTEVTGCVLTGQEVLRGGAEVSVGLLQQLQPVFHRHLHGDTGGRKIKSRSSEAALSYPELHRRLWC